MKSSVLAALSAALLLAGCSNLQRSSDYSAQPLPPVHYQPGELNRETLYELLSAEIAGQRQLYPQALDNYLRQARLTRDPGVAERATRIAQYLREPDSIRQAALLWISADPTNPEPYQIAASVMLHQGDYPQALPLLEQALQTDQSQTLALIDSRAAQMEPETLAGYLALLDTQLKQDPENASLHRSRGVLLRQQGDEQAALQALNRAQQLAPNQLDIMAQKADLLRAMDQTEPALTLVRKALAIEPDNRQLKLLRIQLLFDSDRAEQGSNAALELIEQTPRDAQLHLYLALLMLDADLMEPSRRILQQLLEQYPQDSTPHFYLGFIEQRDNRVNAAIAHYQQVDDGPKLYQAYARIAALLDSAEHKARLSQIVADGRALHPEIARLLYTMEAEWLHLYDLTDEALALLEEALAEFDNDPDLLYTRAMLIEASDFSQAEKDLREVIRQQPDNSQALNALGYTLTLHTERYQEALALIERALAGKPDDPAILDSMGWVLFKLQRYSDSIDYLERAYQQYPDPEVAGHLIQSYQANGQLEKARQLLDNSLTSDPDNSFLLEAAEALSNR
ncbi:tetratricopeptide repeat protein [Marinobacterium arenosum]|uniref:tetratricopeptide repeat protein n=1 Tax=Marinobacterium arenosum TaxID=2862496 RepID=UPI001C9412AF|nr:tetratricopeptide repeat protein [Marinobacterium arenosum]MBY4675692.1 tetratricopeptide repeat protein [Marinobacterium arenosum]